MHKLLGCFKDKHVDKATVKEIIETPGRLSPQKKSIYLEFATVAAQLFEAEFVTVALRDDDIGLNGVTYCSSKHLLDDCCAVQEFFMKKVKNMQEISSEVSFNFCNTEESVRESIALTNFAVCPVRAEGAHGLIGLASSSKLDMSKRDLRLLGTLKDLLQSELEPLSSQNNANATVLFDASAAGWRALLTSPTWRQMTGIQNGQHLSALFEASLGTIPITGNIQFQKQECDMTWEYSLDLQPAKVAVAMSGKEKSLFWVGTMLSATVISPGVEAHDQDVTIGIPETAISLNDVCLGALLGKGGFGNVYRAVWQGKHVAIKILEKPPLAQFDTLQEAKIGERLNNNNIVNTIASGYDTWNGNRCTWIMMELCEKGTLWQAIECGYFTMLENQAGSDCNGMHLNKVLRSALQIAAGMKYLHENNILHGDLNCNNILMSSEMEAKISDLGLSRIFAGNTLDTDTFGTISHQPPELLATGQLSLSSDIYSFGVVLFEICSGKRAYHGLRPAQIITQKLADEILRLPETVPFKLRDFIERCMSKDHHMRPTFYEVYSWLHDYAD